MTWPYDMQFEVRTTGHDDNGGGFSRTGSGTDYSKQASPALNQTDLEIHATDDSKVKDTAGNLGAAHVGNVLHVTGGTGFNTGWYYCKAWDGTWMSLAYMSIAVGTTSSTGGSFRVGGCFASVAGALTMIDNVFANHYTYALDDSIVWVKAGTYSHTTTLAPTSDHGGYEKTVRLLGYNATRGDLNSPFMSWMGTDNRPVLEWTAAVNAWDPTYDYGWHFSNIVFDGTSTALRGANVTHYASWRNVLFRNFTEYGYYGDRDNVLTHVEVDNCGNLASGYAGMRVGNASCVDSCWIHDCKDVGFQTTKSCQLVRCLLTNNAGRGAYDSSWGLRATNNLFYGNGSHGLEINYYQNMQLVRDNIFYGNGGYGLKWNGDISDFEWPTINTNAFRNNTSGDSDQNAGLNKITLTADPFTAAGSDDYSLNDAAGGGALLRAAGFQGLDVGPLQHADPAGGGGIIAVQRPMIL